MSRVLRLAKILRVAGKYRLDELLDSDRLPALPRTALKLSPWRLSGAPELPRGVRLRKALEELGPVFIKFGQMLSAGDDVSGDEWDRRHWPGRPSAREKLLMLAIDAVRGLE